MIAQNQLPPFDSDAEAGALGCVLTADGSAPELLAELRREDFYDRRHQTVYTACTRVQPLNLVTVAQWLKDNGQEENAGGLGYFARLPDQTPSPANFPYFLETLKDRALRRAALHDAGELAQLARDTTIPGNALAEAARRFLEAHAAGARSALPEMVDACEFLAEPLPEPEQLIRGVLHQGSKLALGGGSKSFKTWALVDLALSVAHGAGLAGIRYRSRACGAL